MKAIIPVAGTGVRLRPHTHTLPKPLIPVGAKNILSYTLDQLISYGVKDFVFIIGYLGDKVKAYVEENYPGISKTFVHQEERVGSGYALWLAREHFRNEDEILIYLGDIIIEADLKPILRSPGNCLGVMTVEDPRLFGVVEKDPDGKVIGVVEKPRIPHSNLAMVGVYKIHDVSLCLDALEHTISQNIRTNEEYQLTDALMEMIRRGANFTTYPVSNWSDCGRKESLLETNALLLDKIKNGTVSAEGLKNAVIIPPVHINPGCQIENSIIGPHVTIGKEVKISASIIRSSIIGDFARIDNVVLSRSVIGNDSRIQGKSQSLNIGDNTEIELS